MTIRSATCLSMLVFIASYGVATAQSVDFEFSSGSDDLKDELRASSLLRELRSEGVVDPQELLAAARADYARLLGTLYENAHFGGVISIRVNGREAAGIPPLAAPARIDRIVVDVDPGPAYLFSQTEVAPLAPGTELPDEFATGQPAETPVIRNAAVAATLAWQNVGYAKAEVADQDITARHEDNAVAVRLGIDTGPRVRFGDISVSGNEDVRAKRIRIISGLEPGTLYTPTEIERAEARLRRTGAFRSVVVREADTVDPDQTLDLDIQVVEQTPRRFGVGAEYSNVEGIRLSAFWLHRNLMGGAERLRFDAEVAGLGGETGGIDYRLAGRFERPAIPRADTDAYLQFELERQDEPDFLSDTVRVELGFTRYLSDDLTVEYGVGYEFSDVTDDFGERTYELLTLPLSAELDRRDSALNPTSGYFADLELTPFYGVLGTDSGARLSFDGRGYTAFSDDRLILAARLQLGSLVGPDLVQSPPTYRFFSGGGGTVRGQDYQSLGVIVSGDKTGGRSFVGLSGEVRGRVRENIQAVAFYDWGYIGRESFYDGSGNSHAGAGLGLRYLTGIGPIRLDVAVPVAGDTGASNYYFYVGIGQAF